MHGVKSFQITEKVSFTPQGGKITDARNSILVLRGNTFQPDYEFKGKWKKYVSRNDAKDETGERSGRGLFYVSVYLRILREGRQIIKSSVKAAFQESSLGPHKYELHTLIT